ncbi:MAG: tyrosine-type recombinase/integrase [Epsilonproteobacteria bacterium]|nr:recombinase XerC [Campylobacterota bacterium]NPA56206.1 tyrosine-type recombinase/integrase [Campylobacterota bacterium]
MRLERNGFIPDLQRWFRAYVGYMESLDYSKNTVELYSSVIEEFIEYSREFQDEMEMRDINTLYITSFLVYMEKRAIKRSRKKLKRGELSKSSKKTYLKAVKGFLIFISDNNSDSFTFEKIFDKIRFREQKAEEHMEYLSDEEVERLLRVVEEEKRYYGRYDNYRNALLMKLMLYGGLRISEALNLTLADFSLLPEGVYRIKVQGKGSRDQFAYVDSEKIKEELFYFEHRISPTTPIMKTNRGKVLARQNAFTIARRLYRKAGITKQGLHLLRHTFAMRLAKRGVDVLVIKKALRHASINSTMVYARAEEGDIVRVLKER